MGHTLSLAYRHDSRTAEPVATGYDTVREMAATVRRQTGTDARPACSLEALLGIDNLNVNGVTFELCWSTEHAVTNRKGEPVLGVCEYDHEGLPGIVSLLINPEIVRRRTELLLSTAAHELGHAVFDGPGWVQAHTTMALPGLFGDTGHHAAFSEVIPDEAHLLREQRRSDRERLGEWRANEFMGALLVPREPLAEAMERRALAHRLPLEAMPDDPLGIAPGDRGQRITWPLTGRARDVAAPALFKELAALFGVTPRFIEVRLKCYGLLDKEYRRSG